MTEVVLECSKKRTISSTNDCHKHKLDFVIDRFVVITKFPKSQLPKLTLFFTHSIQRSCVVPVVTVTLAIVLFFLGSGLLGWPLFGTLSINSKWKNPR